MNRGACETQDLTPMVRGIAGGCRYLELYWPPSLLLEPDERLRIRQPTARPAADTLHERSWGSGLEVCLSLCEGGAKLKT